MAREDLENASEVHEDEERIKAKISDICQDLREDIAASHGLNTGRYIRVKYEDLLETPTNTTLELLERLELPRHRDTLSLLDRVERIQLDLVSQWTGDTREHLRRVTSLELAVPDVSLEEDLVSQYVTNKVEEAVREECEDVMFTLGYNVI